MDSYKGHIVDVVRRQIVDGEVVVDEGRIAAIRECVIPQDYESYYILPGFIDSHVHIESSMMLPSEYARMAVEHGTIGIVTDPHEIANVLGEAGVDFMIADSRRADFNFCFGAPSCVPSCGTDIETSGESLDSKAVERLMAREEIGYLSEMMNYPGVLNGDPEVLAKIALAKKYGKPIDGHAPGLVGRDRERYAAAGITTDHECATLEEGRDCIKAGMMVQIREGSAAKNYDALIPLLRESPESVMFCTDDCHPDDLVRDHIFGLVHRALTDGYELWDVLQAACVNPQRHYGLDWGLLQQGDRANFIIMKHIHHRMRVMRTFINGTEVYNYNSFKSDIQSRDKCLKIQKAILDNYPNKFLATPIVKEDIALELKPGDTVHIIKAEDGSLLTKNEEVTITGNPLKDCRYPWAEVQKIVVYNRYTPGAKPHVGLVRGFGIKNGAMASTVAHDCHNIVAIGASDKYLLKAINRVIEMKGGLVALNDDVMTDLALPIAGLISPLNALEIAFRSHVLRDTIADAGCMMKAPFITMGFMCLPVIPELKITDKGLFDSGQLC